MLWGAFNNSSSAMQAYTTDLGSISQNIANLNTTGYKRQETQFSTVMSEHKASPNSYLSGLNIFGVQAAQRNLIDAQGVITPSTTWSDLAINGKGFFMVAPPTSGAQPSTTAAGAGATNVPTTIDTNDAQSVMYTRAGAWHRAYGADTDPNLARSYFLDNSGGYLLGWMADDTGAIPANAKLEPVYTLAPRPIANNGTNAVNASNTQTPISQTMAGRATTTASVQGNLPRDATTTQKIPIEIYDNNFAGQLLSLNFNKTASNSWTMSVANDPNNTTTLTAVPTTDMVFDGNGQLITPADGKVNLSLTWTDAGGATSTANVALDLSKLTQYSDVNNSNNAYIGRVDQDGYGPGRLISNSFNENGELSGYYDNGESRVLFKVPVANFVAENSLEPVSGTMFRRTAEAGALTVTGVDKAPGEARMSTSSLENSTVNIEDEFTRMIMTQKAYSTNAQVFKTADEMTTVARDLKT